MLVGNDSVMEIKIDRGVKDIALSIDGQEDANLQFEDTVVVEKSKYDFHFLRVRLIPRL